MSQIVQRCVVIICASLLCESVRAAESLNEKGFEKLMEEVGKTAKGFKKNQDDKNSAQLTKDAARLAEIFKQTAGFWQNRKVSDAAKWSKNPKPLPNWPPAPPKPKIGTMSKRIWGA